MKKMKKLLTLRLALTLAAGCAAMVQAEEVSDETPEIHTVTGNVYPPESFYDRPMLVEYLHDLK